MAQQNFAPGMPPAGLRSPYSQRLTVNQEQPTAGPSRRASFYNAQQPYSSSRVRLDAAYPEAPASPALSTYSAASHVRRAPLPESSAGGDTPRSSRVYPRTPVNRGAAFAPDENEDTAPFEPFGRPPSAHGQHPNHHGQHELRRSTSQFSIGSNKSIRKYDPNSYVDAAFLTEPLS